MGIELRSSGEASQEQLRCSAEGCEARAIYSTRRLCKRHYWTVYKSGAIAERRAREQLFWSQTIPEPNSGCLLWMGNTTPEGYGIFGGNVERAHRVAWELVNGVIPPGMFVCHRCDNCPCVLAEPNGRGHLFLGTHEENMADMRRKGRKPRGGRARAAVLTDGQAMEVRRLYAAGRPIRALAAQFGVAFGTVQWITSGKHFSHLGGPIIRQQ